MNESCLPSKNCTFILGPNSIFRLSAYFDNRGVALPRLQIAPVLMESTQLKILIFAHIPPPLHGQSLMVERAVAALREKCGNNILHVDARWSDSLSEIGEGTWKKILRAARYLISALRLRATTSECLLYYVPGPVKWSALVRDWAILAVLRPVFSGTIFHWHAIGQGEWAHGSKRVRLSSRPWLEALARTASRMILAKPRLSITVSDCSDLDAIAVGSNSIKIVPNGLVDPFNNDFEEFHTTRIAQYNPNRPRWLFLSRGNSEKGITDLLLALIILAPIIDPRVQISIRIAGGVEDDTRAEVDSLLERFKRTEGHQLFTLEWIGFADDSSKEALWKSSDLLIYPSRWESFGLVLLEAMARGIPVLACDSDGACGILGRDSPLLVATKDHQALANRLHATLLDHNLEYIDTLGRSLRNRYLQSFNLSDFEMRIGDAIKGLKN